LVRILGLDPGLQRTGWGVIALEGTRLHHIAHGVVRSSTQEHLSQRLVTLFRGLQAVLADWMPEHAAVETTFVNKNPQSTLKLGQARSIALLVPALAGICVAEYAPNVVKKSVVGVGHAQKIQISAMVARLLPQAGTLSPDSADALAIALCHAHHLPGLKYQELTRKA
jgi:crossover junction endodeoxyribonuclease RuvC